MYNSFITSLQEIAQNHKVINHPYLIRLEGGFFPNIKNVIKDFMFQYYAYSENFVRCLVATIAHLDNVKHRQALLDNLFEEAGHLREEDIDQLIKHNIDPKWVDGFTHVALFRRFLDGVGMDEQFRKKAVYSDEAIRWKNMFFALCSQYGPEQALGAIGLGTENIVKHIYRHILTAIARFMPEISTAQRVIFDLHTIIDDRHGEILTNITADYAAVGKINRLQIKEGMLISLNLRHNFFDAMQKRAETHFTT